MLILHGLNVSFKQHVPLSFFLYAAFYTAPKHLPGMENQTPAEPHGGQEWREKHEEETPKGNSKSLKSKNSPKVRGRDARKAKI